MQQQQHRQCNNNDSTMEQQLLDKCNIIMHVVPVTPQFPDLKISLNKSIRQSTSQKECHISQTTKSLNQINISLSFA